MKGTHCAKRLSKCPPTIGTPLEKSIRRAHQLLCADLQHLEQLREENVDVVYSDFFGGQFHEKIAAIIYLAQRSLLDIADSPAELLDAAISRRISSLLVEILYRLNAAEGLGYLYDFAAAHTKSGNATFWQKVCRHYLQLMAMLPIARPRVLAFLSERPDARHDVEVGIAAVDVNVARAFRALGEDYLRARKNGPLEPFTPAEYTLFYRQYVQEEPNAQTAGLSTRLAVQERINRAVAAGDIPALAPWFTDGSPLAVRYLMQTARSGLAASSFMDLLVSVVAAKQWNPVRGAAAVLEMSEINRTLQPNGGDININQQFVSLAMTDDSARFGIARLAVQELGAIGAFNEVLTVLEQAPYIDVAGEGIAVLLEAAPPADGRIDRRPPRLAAAGLRGSATIYATLPWPDGCRLVLPEFVYGPALPRPPARTESPHRAGHHRPAPPPLQRHRQTHPLRTAPASDHSRRRVRPGQAGSK